MARLVVADNSPFYRQMLLDALSEKGHDVEVVGDGSEALRAVGESRPDAVVLDLVMPKLNGGRACRRLKDDPATASIPVIILSGIRQDEMGDLDEIGADAYVAKMHVPDMMAHLLGALDEVLLGAAAVPLRGFESMHRREVVSELLEERRSRDEILASLSEGVLRVTGEGLILDANPAALRMLGTAGAQVVNQELVSVLGGDAVSVQGLLGPQGGTGLRLSSGERTLQVRRRGSDEGGNIFVLLTDVSDEVRADRERRSLEKRVEASERLSALGEIVSGVAHELNNPLTGVLGYADLLLELSTDERTRARLEKLRHEALRCRHIVENLLCFARKRQSYRRMQDLNQVVRKAVSALALDASRAGVEVVQDLEANLPALPFDFPQLEQVLANLLSNSFQALSSRPAGERRVTVRTQTETGRVLLEVQDNGSGVAPEIRDRLFEPFVTTRRPEGGTGLGLAVSYGIIEEHGGRISFSDTSPGTCFRIELPVAAATGRPATAARRERPSVLVVDDEPVIQELIQDVLADEGFGVQRAGNGAEALEKLRQTPFSAIIIDMKMPDMDGRQLYAAIRERRPELGDRMIFMTGDAEHPGHARFLSETGSPVLRKPFRLDEVADACRTLMASGGGRGGG